MRIIAGSARGIKLETPEGYTSRPTLERIKENFFNAIHFQLAEAKVLDLFAGVGQLGLEALSRGADKAVFIEKSPECAKIIKQNAQKARLAEKCIVLNCDYSEYLSSIGKKREKEQFDIIFADPPYDSNYLVDIIKKISKSDLLSQGGMLICETDYKEISVSEKIYLYKQYKYGKIYVTILKMKTDDE